MRFLDLHMNSPDVFKLGDYFTKFYEKTENRLKYGSMWCIMRIIGRDIDEITVNRYSLLINKTATCSYPESHLLESYSSGSIKKSTINEIFCYINSVIRENQI